MHAPIPAVFSLFVLPLSFFHSILFLLLISNYYLAVGCSSFWSFLFLCTSLWVLTTLLPWVFPLKCFPPFGLPLLVFFSLPLFFPLPFGSFNLPWLPSFYSQLIQWDFSLLLLGLHQLFLVCCGHLFKITHLSIGCPCHCSVQYMSTAPLLISRQNFFLFVPAVYIYLTT